MSEKSTKKQLWSTAQKLGFWFLLTALFMFWSGMYLGGVAAQNTITDRENAKTQGVEAYKAEQLKDAQ